MSSVLLASLPSLSIPHFLSPVIDSATSATRNALTIVLLSRLFTTDAISHSETFDDVQRLLTFVYARATHAAQAKGRMLMEIDVLLKGLDEDLPHSLGEGAEVVFRVQGDVLAVSLPPSIASLPSSWLPSSLDTPPPSHPHSPSTPLPSFFRVVALGGTFDHLHAGHKILLSMGLWITSEKLIVGVTSHTLLSNKKNREFLQALDQRCDNVRRFVKWFKPGVEPHIVEIDDVYGPTGWDPDVQGLVVSEETRSGAEAIAAHRLSKSLPALRTFIIDVISHADSDVKMSSTFIRAWIAEHGEGKA